MWVGVVRCSTASGWFFSTMGGREVGEPVEGARAPTWLLNRLSKVSGVFVGRPGDNATSSDPARAEVLDVGCGDHPRGTVNCDLNVNYTLQGGDQKSKGIYINPRATPNFVRCEAHHLPFRDGAFERVVNSHVIEHVTNPLLLLKELLRVSRGEVEIRCPHRLNHNAKGPYHLHHFDRGRVTRLLSAAGAKNIKYMHRGVHKWSVV